MGGHVFAAPCGWKVDLPRRHVRRGRHGNTLIKTARSAARLIYDGNAIGGNTESETGSDNPRATATSSI
jgi:hypothetical protein